ncbi:MAG: DUF2207 domain-containing protein [Euryarchaeota archaeon]|nr:DUF2207 domain-containing protein [Euryarchaeota archaeon]
MNKKMYLSIIFLVLFSLFITSSISYAEDRSYSIPYVNIDLFLQENGILHVKEKIHYHFSGTYNGVYRDIPLKSYERLENLKIYAEGAYSTYEVSDYDDKKSIKIYLYSDPGKLTPISDRDVDVIIEYDFLHVITFYNDVAELQYKLWGEDWEVDVGKVNANIHPKSKEGVKYWLNPHYFSENSAWHNQTLQITSKPIKSGQWFELRMVIPKNQFIATDNGNVVGVNGLNDIEKIQKDYEYELNFKTAIYLLLTILILLSIAYPLFVYYRLLGSPKITYDAGNEGEIPKDDPPALINALFGPGFSKQIGEPDINGFIATILDLVDRDYLTLFGHHLNDMEKKPKCFISLKINRRKKSSGLKRFELDVLEFLKKFERNNIVPLTKLKEKIEDNPNLLRKTFHNWRNHLVKKFLNHEQMKKIFIKKNNAGLYIYGFSGILISGLIFYITFKDSLPVAVYPFYSSIILGIASFMSLIMTQKVKGRWTDYGKQYRAKWQNFKKYIKNPGSIKENPPESIRIYDKYLIYATALGIPDKAIKSLKSLVPEEELRKSDIYIFHAFGGYSLLKSILYVAIGAYAVSGAFYVGDGGMGGTGGAGGVGGVGGVGDGSGGGGGGAF